MDASGKRFFWCDGALLANYEAVTLPLLFASTNDFELYFETMFKMHHRKQRLLRKLLKINQWARYYYVVEKNPMLCVETLEKACQHRQSIFSSDDFQVTAAYEHFLWSLIQIGVLQFNEGNMMAAHSLLAAASAKIHDASMKRLGAEGIHVTLSAHALRVLKVVLHHNWCSYWIRRRKCSAAAQHASHAVSLWSIVKQHVIGDDDISLFLQMRKGCALAFAGGEAKVVLEVLYPLIAPDRRETEKPGDFLVAPQLDEPKEPVDNEDAAVQQYGVNLVHISIRYFCHDDSTTAAKIPLSCTVCLESSNVKCSSLWPINRVCEFAAAFAAAFVEFTSRKYSRANKLLQDCAAIARGAQQPCNAHWWSCIEWLYELVQVGPETNLIPNFATPVANTRTAECLLASQIVRDYVQARRAGQQLEREYDVRMMKNPAVRCATAPVESDSQKELNDSDAEGVSNVPRSPNSATADFKRCWAAPSFGKDHSHDVDLGSASRSWPRIVSVFETQGTKASSALRALGNDASSILELKAVAKEALKARRAATPDPASRLLIEGASESASVQAGSSSSRLYLLPPAPQIMNFVPVNAKRGKGAATQIASLKRFPKLKPKLSDYTVDVYTRSQRRLHPFKFQDDNQDSVAASGMMDPALGADNDPRAADILQDALLEHQVRRVEELQQHEVEQGDAPSEALRHKISAIEKTISEHGNRVATLKAMRERSAAAQSQLEAEKKNRSEQVSSKHVVPQVEPTPLTQLPQVTLTAQHFSPITAEAQEPTRAASSDSAAMILSPSIVPTNAGVVVTTNALDKRNTLLFQSQSPSPQKRVSTDPVTGVVFGEKIYDFVPEATGLQKKQGVLRAMLPSLDAHGDTYRLVSRELAENEAILQAQRQEQERRRFERNAAKIAKKPSLANAWKRLIAERRSGRSQTHNKSTPAFSRATPNELIRTQEGVAVVAAYTGLALMTAQFSDPPGTLEVMDAPPIPL